MFGRLKNWRNRRILRKARFGERVVTTALASLPFLEQLDQQQRQRLVELAILFCHEKRFEGAHGLDITDHMRLFIALQACLPILELGLDCYRGWVSIIVYPAAFAPERLIVDEDGVEHVERRDLSGEAWQQGPVILSWEDVEYPGWAEGVNLVIHEFAHKLDMQNGEANGFPPLHRGMDTEIWSATLQAGFDDLQLRCDADEEALIDCYAANSPAEFFAVLSEVFFMRADLLQYSYPQIYQQFRLYYRQDPLARIAPGPVDQAD